MKKLWKILFNSADSTSCKPQGRFSVSVNHENGDYVKCANKIETPYIDSVRAKKIEKGAKDFATRFEDVMRELANG